MKNTTTSLLCLSLFLIFSLQAPAQQFWGLTELGGGSDLGTIFRTDTGGSNLMVKYTFTADLPGASPQGDLIQAANGKLYGMTSAGEANESGILFEYDPVTTSYSKLVEFTGPNGANPAGSLIQATNGKIYGLTLNGGTSGMGVLFEYDLSNSTYTIKVNFSGPAEGANPRGSLIQAKNGLLYGMASTGGINNVGTIFSYNLATSSLTKLVDFNGVSNGASPAGALMQSTSGKLFGLTFNGGMNNIGVLFQFDPATLIYTKLKDFSAAATGANPQGALLEASNGKLYGMTTGGGANSSGIIFEYDTLSAAFTNKIDFDGIVQGGSPSGSLIEIPGGNLYGMNNLGGTGSSGILFEYNLASATLTDKIDFTGSNGASPQGSVVAASNGKLYGMTYAGGINGNGVLFEYDPAMNSYANKIDFNTASAGANPTSSLIQASNGKLYGMTSAGGVYGVGTLFEFDTTTSTYTKKVDFDGPVNGFSPKGALIQASNGKLYGMANSGGANNDGVLFEFDPVTSIYTKKVDLLALSSGSNPFGTLIQAKNGLLYGTTYNGGNLGNGTLFEYDPLTASLTTKVHFDYSLTGANPYSALLQVSTGKLYGMTLNGGVDSSGVLFSYDIGTGTYSKKMDFNYHIPAGGYNPNGALIEGPNGKLYGLTTLGGSSDNGVIFEYDTSSNVYAVKHSLVGSTDGLSPQSSLIMASDKKLYGMASNGGAIGYGTLFAFDPALGIFSKKDDFNLHTTGGVPYGDLLFICNALAITAQPADTSKCTGNSTLLHVTAVGTALNYQWYKNGILIPGANSGSYTIPVVSLSDSGSYYCMIGNSCGTANSATENLKVYAGPATPVITQSGSVLSSTAAAGYQWYLNGALLAGATSQSYTTVQNGNYTVAVSNSNLCSTVSAPYMMLNTGIAEKQDQGLTELFPNPVSTMVNIIYGATSESTSNIAIMDMLGNIVLDTRITSGNTRNSAQLDVSSLPSGLYILKLSNGGNHWLRKFNKR
jgi:uncharacterized repeat protein (TIGR03803 family)